MTGIAAILASGPAGPARLGRMVAAMADRAKDGTGEWIADRFALGAALLHSTAESFEAAQPWATEDDGLALVMDGYLTNWDDLRRDLAQRGAALRNGSDAELVLRAYEQWGEDCTARLQGEFAFVIADRRANRIYAARDHQGLRPLYYYHDADALLIASDLRALIAGCRDLPAPDFDFLANIVSNQWFLRDATVWKGVRRVPPGHWLAWDGTRLKTGQHFQLPLGRTLRYAREQDYIEHYREMLFDVVRRTSRSHRPLAITVSGGLDSSAIFAVSHELQRQGRLLAPGMQAYTLAGEAGTDADELDYARAAAAHCQRPLIEVPLSQPGLEWFADLSGRICDVPVAANGAMSLGLEEAAFGDGARTYVTGDGGDQWLDGSIFYYREYAARLAIGAFLGSLRRDARAAGWATMLPRAMRMAVGAMVPAALRRWRQARRIELAYAGPDHLFWLKPEWRDRLREQHRAYEDSRPADPAQRLRYGRQGSPYATLARDWMARQWGDNGLDPRNPMLSAPFIAFAAALPEEMLNRAGITRYIHREAMRGILPDRIIERQTKADFMSVFPSSDFARHVFAARNGALSALSSPDGVAKLAGAHDQFQVDPYLDWEIWGHYAAAVFLAANARTPLEHTETGIEHGQADHQAEL